MKLQTLPGDIWTGVYAQIDLKNATVLIKDGTATPNSIAVKIGTGNCTYSERRNIEYTLDRGILDEVREGDQVPVELRFDFVWEYIISASGGTVTVEDALKQQGEAAAWTSSDADACRPYAVDVQIEYIPECTGDSEEIAFADFRYEQLDHDLRNGSVACSGKCNILQPTITRGTISTG